MCVGGREVFIARERGLKPNPYFWLGFNWNGSGGRADVGAPRVQDGPHSAPGPRQVTSGAFLQVPLPFLGF